jgi:hypothetical protein
MDASNQIKRRKNVINDERQEKELIAMLDETISGLNESNELN